MTDHLHEAETFARELERERSADVDTPPPWLAADQGYALRQVIYHSAAAIAEALGSQDMSTRAFVERTGEELKITGRVVGGSEDVFTLPAEQRPTDWTPGSEFDCENDWSGEVRYDPVSAGNAFVLREVYEDKTRGRIMVLVNDILGGHRRSVDLDTWLSWPKELP